MSVTCDAFMEDRLTGKSLEDLLRLIGDEEKGVRTEAMEYIRCQGLAAVYDTLEAAVRDDNDADLRNGAMDMLVAFGSTALPQLIPLLKDANEEVRNFSAVMLGRIGSRDAVAPLVEALRDPDMNVQHAAAEALGIIGDRSALLPLLALLKGDFWQQCPAIYAMGALRDERAVPYLLPLVDHELLGEPAMESLGKIGDSRALHPLVERINRSPVQLCAAAAKGVMDIVRHPGQPISPEYLHRFQQTIAPRGVTNLLHLVSSAKERDDVVAAVTLLGWLGEISAVPSLLSLLQDDGYIELVERTILSLGEPAIPFLWEALEAPLMDVRIVALRVLRWLDGSKDIARILPLLLNDAPEVQREALNTLSGSRDRVLEPHLVSLVREGGAAVRLAALEVLAGYGGKTCLEMLEELAGSPDEERRCGAAFLAGAMTEGGIDRLLVLMADPTVSVRAQAVVAAGRRCPAEALPALRAALGDDEPVVREHAVQALAAFEDDSLLPDILALLPAADERLAVAIVTAVGRIGSPGAASALVSLMGQRGMGRSLEYAVIDALGHLEPLDDDVVEILKGYLGHRDPDIRRLAVSTLVRVARASVFDDIAPLANDPHWSVRISLLEGIKAFEEKEATDLLVAALGDGDSMVRKHAAAILGERREVSAARPLAMLLGDGDSSRAAFDALLAIGTACTEDIHGLLRSGEFASLRERLIDLLGRIGNGASVEVIFPFLDDTNPAIRMAAIDSLVFCFDRMLRTRLTRISLSDPDADVRRRAELVLRAISLEYCC